MPNPEVRSPNLVSPTDGQIGTDSAMVPEDVIAEQDAAERQLQEEFRVRPDVAEAAEETLAERDVDIRAAEDALREQLAGR
jgi:hypothetical protein